MSPLNVLVCLAPLVPALATGAALDRVTVEKSDSVYVVEGAVQVAASPEAVFRAITDYDRLARLDPGIAESRLIERESESVALVYTRLTGCVLFFCRKVDRVERVEELSGQKIVSEVVPADDGDADDVRYARSSWTLSPAGTGTRIDYRTEVEPNFWIPAMIGPAVVRRVLRRHVRATLSNLEQVAQTYE